MSSNYVRDRIEHTVQTTDWREIRSRLLLGCVTIGGIDDENNAIKQMHEDKIINEIFEDVRNKIEELKNEILKHCHVHEAIRYEEIFSDLDQMTK